MEGSAHASYRQYPAESSVRRWAGPQAVAALSAPEDVQHNASAVLDRCLSHLEEAVASDSMGMREAMAKVREKDTALGRANKRLGKAEQLLGKAEGGLRDATGKLAGSEKALGEAKRQLGDAEKRAADLDKRRGRAEAKLGEAEAGLREAHGALGEARAELAETKKSLGVAEAKLTDAEARAASWEGRAAAERRRAEQSEALASEASSLERARAALEEQLQRERVRAEGLAAAAGRGARGAGEAGNRSAAAWSVGCVGLAFLFVVWSLLRPRSRIGALARGMWCRAGAYKDTKGRLLMRLLGVGAWTAGGGGSEGGKWVLRRSPRITERYGESPSPPGWGTPGSSGGGGGGGLSGSGEYHSFGSPVPYSPASPVAPVVLEGFMYGGREGVQWAVDGEGGVKAITVTC